MTIYTIDDKQREFTDEVKNDVTGFIMAWEDGNLNIIETTKLFAWLGRTQQVYQLQGVYGRTYEWLMDLGIITNKQVGTVDFDRLEEISNDSELMCLTGY